MRRRGAAWKSRAATTTLLGVPSLYHGSSPPENKQGDPIPIPIEPTPNTHLVRRSATPSTCFLSSAQRCIIGQHKRDGAANTRDRIGGYCRRVGVSRGLAHSGRRQRWPRSSPWAAWPALRFSRVPQANSKPLPRGCLRQRARVPEGCAMPASSRAGARAAPRLRASILSWAKFVKGVHVRVRVRRLLCSAAQTGVLPTQVLATGT